MQVYPLWKKKRKEGGLGRKSLRLQSGPEEVLARAMLVRNV